MLTRIDRIFFIKHFWVRKQDSLMYKYKTVHTQIFVFLVKNKNKKEKVNQTSTNQIIHLFGPKPLHRSHYSGAHNYFLLVGKY